MCHMLINEKSGNPIRLAALLSQIKTRLPFVKRLKREQNGVYSPIIIMIGYRFVVWRASLKDQNLVRPIRHPAAGYSVIYAGLPSSRYHRLILLVASYNLGKFV